MPTALFLTLASLRSYNDKGEQKANMERLTL